MPKIAWTFHGRHFEGEAFFPAQWKPDDRLPLYVAVRAPAWDHGCVERDANKGNRGRWVATLALPHSPIRLLSMSDPVDIEQEIEQERNSYAHESETTKQAIIKARRGQGDFRQELKTMWHGQCAVTECKETSILQASHIKPWRNASNRERLDRFNGLLLTPNLHSALDLGLISFEDDGKILFSKSFSSADARALGLHPHMRLRRVFPANKPYLAHHRHLWISPLTSISRSQN